MWQSCPPKRIDCFSCSDACVWSGIVMLKKNFIHLQIGSYSSKSCFKFLKGLNICFRVDSFSSWHEINKNKSLGISEDIGHDFSR